MIYLAFHRDTNVVAPEGDIVSVHPLWIYITSREELMMYRLKYSEEIDKLYAYNEVNHFWQSIIEQYHYKCEIAQ